MHIEIRDLQSGQTHRIGVDGATIGRDPARSDVTVSDKGVSSMHAKIYGKDGRWFLEDLKSSNGTFVNEQKIHAPVQLGTGQAFALFRYRFEVKEISSENSAHTSLFDSSISQNPMSAKTAVLEAKPLVKPVAHDGVPTVRGGANAGSKSETRPATAKPRLQPEATGKTSETAAVPSELGEGFGANLKAAIVHYMSATPRMAVNPVGATVRTIDEPIFPAMQPAELVAWALPANAVVGFVGVLATLVATLLVGGNPLSLLGSAIIGALITTIGSVLAGFLWHPLFGWMVAVLGGDSDEESRSNMFVAVFSALPLVALPGALGVFVALSAVPFLGAAPLVLGLFANLIVVFVLFSWLRHLGAARWFLVAVVGLGLLASATTVQDLVAVVRAGAVGLKGGAMARELAEPPAPMPAKKPEAVAPRVENPPPAPTPEPGPQATEPTKLEEAKPAAPPPGKRRGPTPYPEYFKKRTAIEQAVDADPTLLTRVDGVLALYKRLHRESERVTEKLAKAQKGKHDKNDKVQERLREAEIYAATVEIVDDLHRVLFERR